MKRIAAYLVVLMIIISSCKETSVHDPDEVIIVNDIFEKVLDDGSLISKDDGKIAIDDYLSPLKDEDLSSLKASGLYLDYNFEKEKKKMQLDIDQITNLGSYSIVTSESRKEEAAKVYFSRVYFDENKEKGILISQIFCGEYCYEKKVITVEKDKGSGKWTIIDTNILEIA
jgi:hypothetical protein